ncbi:MAG: ferrous iron transport protein A [Candidatus Moduliflexus flocculans]|nr:ferrous iron transport protein A [Candidatus Moduliflexus flocculans]
MKNLGEIKAGQQVEILEFVDSAINCLFTRFGIEKGQVVTCVGKPGPVIIQKKQQEIAIGKDLSRQVLVKVV